MIPFEYLVFFSFKSYTASFAPVDCSEIPLSFNGFSCVAHNIANATPTSKLHTARMFKTSLAGGRFLDFSTTRLACGLLSISCNNTIVRPNILGATSLLQPTKYRSQIRTQYPHSWHGLTLKSCDPHVRKNEVMPVAGTACPDRMRFSKDGAKPWRTVVNPETKEVFCGDPNCDPVIIVC